METKVSPHPQKVLVRGLFPLSCLPGIKELQYRRFVGMGPGFFMAAEGRDTEWEAYSA